jgi:hypothetical protein
VAWIISISKFKERLGIIREQRFARDGRLEFSKLSEYRYRDFEFCRPN